MKSITGSAKTAADYMTDNIVVLSPEMNLIRAMHMLVGNHVSCAPVVDSQGNLVGMLTEKDCFRAAFEARYHSDLVGPVSRYMNSPVDTVSADTAIVAVVDGFYRSRYRRLPVVADNRLVGLISRRDVLRALEEHW